MSKNSKDPTVYETGYDPRLDFMLDLLTKSLKIKPDRWFKLYAVDENRIMITEFFEKAEAPNLLILWSNAMGQLVATTSFPVPSRTKGLYFMKKHASLPVTKNEATFKSNLIYGDLAPQPLECLVSFIEEGVNPVVTTSCNQDIWPDQVTGDVKQNVQQVTSVLYSLQGQLRGRTQLPLPLNLEELEENARQLQEMGPSEVDLQLKTQIESLIIKWAQQINEVLKQDSSKVFQNGTNHPTPSAELAFWEERVQDLQWIYEQLNDSKVRKLASILEGTKSAYWPAYRSMFVNVVGALAEAQDILVYLKPLKKHIDNVQTASFDDLMTVIRPFMHCVCLVWAHSRYYCSAARIIVLLQEICNMLIDAARSHLGGSGIFQLDPEEGLAKLTIIVDTLILFRVLYDEHRQKLRIYFEERNEEGREQEPWKTWDFLPSLVFTRFDRFLSRMVNLKEFFESSTEYYKLERVDFGGSNGRSLTSQIQEIYAEFLEFYQKYGSLTYDVSDPEDDTFDKDYNETFKERIMDNDHRLAAICVNAFEDCHTPESIFKLITILGTLLDRPVIKKDMEPKMPEYVKMIEADFEMIVEMFEDQILAYDDPADRREVCRTMPPYSASVHWARNMLSRIQEPVDQFKSLDLPVTNGPEAKRMLEKYEDLSELLNEFIDKTYMDWQEKVKDKVLEYLNQHLITREHERSIVINFNTELAATVKEVKYMRMAGFEDIPFQVEALYSQKDLLRKNLIFLDKIAHSYNKILGLANSFELELLRSQIDHVDQVILEGIESIRWIDETKIWPFIERLRPQVQNLENKLDSSQNNVKEIQKIVTNWKSKPLYERRDGQKGLLLNLDESANERMQKCYMELEKSSVNLRKLVEANRNLLKSDDGAIVPESAWDAYLGYIDGIVLDGMIKAVAVSFGYFADHTDPGLTPSPLMEVKMELTEGEMVFVPHFDDSLPNSFMGKLDDILGDILHQAELVQRVKPSEHADYLPDIECNLQLLEMKASLESRVNSVTEKTFAYQMKFEYVSWIWEDDRQEFLQQFLKYGRQLTPEELDARSVGEEVAEEKPSLEQFKEIIDKFESLYLEVEKFELEKVFDKWFLLDMRPFRQTLLSTVKKWSLMFKQYLIDSVIGGLFDLEKFILDAQRGLTQILREGDLQTLISVMGWLHKVKDRELQYDTMFDPIREYIELLKVYDYELPENVFVQLEELPQRWENLKKLAIQTKHTVAPLQAQEVSSIRKRIAEFDFKQQGYRDGFKKYEFFNQNCQFPYQIIDDTQLEMKKLEEEYEQICSAASLFEVHVPDPKSLKQCRRELKFVKQLWDYIFIVESMFSDWKKTPWKKINVENMDIECKRMAKEVKGMDKDVKHWKIYINLESTVRNMISSLKSVSELQNPSIRERHWQELMVTTKVKFSDNEDTTLADLVGLNLHNFEEEVKNIVDKAVKESSMEKTLKELDGTWKSQEYEFETHPRTGTRLIRASEELIELLEDNQVQLQNIAMSKYIAFFHEEVEFWQNRLFNADQVLSGLTEVQRTWGHLEPIFIATEDIRKNLPEDSARFDAIDTDFKKLLVKVSTTQNVIEATNQPGLVPDLERLQNELSICEKALADYLETKRLAFPRFYFVSSVDLLDILSNGNEPSFVARHLTKLFDATARLEFQTGTKIALAMFAKDGEKVELNEPCDCTGPVEQWLRRLEDAQKATVRHYFSHAVNSYEDKQRDQWIIEYPAQTALCGTQIWWTTEVNIAFSKFEEGYENALKDYYRKQVNQLSVLISLLLGQLTAQERQKIMTVCTIDVHSRDVVGKLIQMKVESAQAFQWQSQLRHRWDDEEGDCYANICDAQFVYWYEYLGNTPRLVITPLTDRCYITLTQSLHLIMGGAPAGPAGTGKTETTKDLGKAIGMMVYVFNCSEQMDYRSIGNIYKGLSQTGAWGCFDEFNRISVDVLSVVAVQVKSIQDAIRDRKTKFNFMGEEIRLNPTVGIFITMNPGYAGRTELPENLKALFRPCAMVVPDFELISEIMLVAEGFQDAKLLAKKFITLYTLCKELLSQQDHYDWGLRAIKSVLVVAGSLKRSDPERPEDQVLMRALRDFNVPKIVTDDIPVFMGLIGDLFPALDVPRKRDLEFEKTVKIATMAAKLQPEDNFVLKVVQLQDILDVRHSVFIIGNAGTGKTQVWKTLYRTHQILKHKPMYNDLNPKAVTNDELFGIINPATREWKDGILSILMRDQANMTGDGPKWIILDGDIDPMWIESLNTVMDDNKVLTLASNERIALTKTMRLLFEIFTLRVATPATVSRAGILYLNPQDLGWNPFVTSWIDSRENPAEKATLALLFEKYMPSLLEAIKHRFKRVTPIPEIAHMQLLCNLLDCLITNENCPADSPKEVLEIYFVFCSIWAFGSACYQDQTMDHRLDFSKWWINEFKYVKFPTSQGTVFDYYINVDTKKLEPWTDIIPPFELDPDVPLQATIVHTGETTRLKFFMDVLLAKGHPMMLVGSAGSGKTVLVADKLNSMPENYTVCNVPFNFYTTSEMLQKVLEKPLEKKAGRNYGPPGNKKLIYFIDDMNMPAVDAYGTVQPHTLIRQHMDYKHWYDRVKITLKDINNVQYVACMNPKAGSFTINPRLQRHFATFSMSFPGVDALQTIYRSILSQHLESQAHKFSLPVQRMAGAVVTSALQLHAKIAQTFLPTAVKFHYVFNLRDLSNVFQGILFSSSECLPDQLSLIRIWLHEADRVYQDKLVYEEDIKTYEKIVSEQVKKGFDDLQSDESTILAQPNIFSHFAFGMGDPKYMPIADFDTLARILTDALASYNEFNSIMNLVLFEDAMNYVVRISRILESPRGNALLVGVGGSGKQSLARLAAYMSSLDVFQIALRKGYSAQELKTDLSTLYVKAGQKNIGTVFLMTDAQVAEETYLVLINDMLASGEIPEILPDDEVENIISSMRTEVKTVGLEDTRDNCWKYFIDRVRRQLKVVLCFSPVGSTLRNRSRKFPAITNCTQIIWFHEWPEEALMSVSQIFVREIEAVPGHLREGVAAFMAYVHASVNEMSRAYLANEKRHNYTTPKSFLEQIGLYGDLVTTKKVDALAKADRLESGLTKLESCAVQVEELKKVLAIQEKVLQEKNEKADELIQVVSSETAVVSKEKENAAVEEQKVASVAEEVAKIKEVCRIELEKAEPALQAAYAALDTLNKANLTELKTFTSPPADVEKVCQAVYFLWVGTRVGGVPKDVSWKSLKSNMMSDSQKFLDGLMKLEKEKITPGITEAMKPYINIPGFVPDRIKTKSFAAGGLCSYVLNVLKFNEVYQDVAPKRKALQDATDQLTRALDRLKYLKNRVKELEEKLTVLTRDYEAATEAKLKCQAEADRTALTIDLANRLVGGLGAEKARWLQNVKNYRESTLTIPGDMLLVTAFVSYVGCFTKRYRVDLLENHWIPHLRQLEPPIPVSATIDPLTMLTDDAEIASWNNFGLPSDRMSSENATILINSHRWPLMIDPQLQGIKWIKNMCGPSLKVIRLGQKGFLDVIEEAISSGETVLIENIYESVDPVLEPLLARNLIKKGKAIRMGDKEIDYDPKFRLILQTKLANPHYKPEMQAQTTLVNFTVTREGLEDQLLAEVVKVERPDLENQKSELTKQQNEFKILLKKLEDDLLTRLQSAQGNFLDDTALVENLETTKRTAADVEVKAKEAVVTSAKIDAARELYRPAAARASLLYFILNDLYKINPIYQFSLKAFSTVFQNAIKYAAHAPEVSKRVESLIDSITFAVWQYTTRGLFESDKLIFTAQMALQVMLMRGIIKPTDLDFLLRFPITPNSYSPVDFLRDSSWGGIVSLGKLEDYRNLDRDIEGSAKRWKKIVESECPEREKLPQEWKNKAGVQRLCIMRALRPDRMTYAMAVFIEESMGLRYVRPNRVPFAQSFDETSNTTPVFFILSPGVDPLKDVEALGKKMGFTFDSSNFHSVSLGQGQEIVAENALDTAGTEGHWVILQNIHLVARWLPSLEKKLEQNWESSHPAYRVFLSAEPAPTPEAHIIPQGILESSIKITNEPPTGMMANIHKALDNFNQESLETCSKELEFKAVLFSLCYFHAVVAERRKFGTQGWNRSYPFNTGDLTISVNVLMNYLEANTKVPWEDLRYLFGEIMYGGHITDDWDRKLCRTYLEEYMVSELLDGEVLYAPGFPAPPSTDYQGYHQYIDEILPPESPILYGLHPNAEIGFLTRTSERLFSTIFELQPRDAGGAGGQVVTKEEKMKQIIDDIMEKLPEPFNMVEISSRAEDKTPYVIVVLQECERMNTLTIEIRRSLKELDLGLKGELTISADMEDLGNSLFMDQVPPAWTKRAYPSTLGLGSWYADLLSRARELEQWSMDFFLPPSVWLGGFFNPQSFLTAIMQSTARKQELPLDKMCLTCEVTKKIRDEITSAPKDGACINGLYMEGARWDTVAGSIVDSKLKELYPAMPVIYLKAVAQEKMDVRNIYECPVYKTRLRGPTYVWTFNLRTKEKPSKWVLAGVALLLQV